MVRILGRGVATTAQEYRRRGRRKSAFRRSDRKGEERTANATKILLPIFFFSQSEGEGERERPLNRGPRNWLIGAPVIALMRQAAESSSSENAMRGRERARAVNNMKTKSHL